jgi:hypothetical protein
MNAIRMVYDAVPDNLSVPPPMRRRRVEVVFLALDEDAAPIQADWSPGCFEQSAATLPELPEREDQGGPAVQVPGSARGRLTIVEEDEGPVGSVAEQDQGRIEAAFGLWKADRTLSLDEMERVIRARAGQ